jgi:hypothetical protein
MYSERPTRPGLAVSRFAIRSVVNTFTEEEPMRLILTTQYRENYGAHDWDGKGECPQYWKNKGGFEYLAADMPDEAFKALSPDEVAKLVKDAEDKITVLNDYVHEYVVSRSVVPAGSLTDIETYFEELLAQQIAEESDRSMYAVRPITEDAEQEAA